MYGAESIIGRNQTSCLNEVNEPKHHFSIIFCYGEQTEYYDFTHSPSFRIILTNENEIAKNNHGLIHVFVKQF